MNLSHQARTSRPGFTLVELLVVIAIIAILIGLLSAAVIKALSKGNEASNMADIRQIAAAIHAFESYYKVSHIPSRIKLCKYEAHYDLINSQLDKDSHAFLSSVWTRLGWKTPTGPNGALEHRRIDWDGTTGGGPDRIPITQSPPAPSAQNVFLLEGGQCLVFFLGGIPTPSGTAGTQGFSPDPTNPARFVIVPTATERVSPFFEFKSNRLARPGTTPFYFYLDAYVQRAYAYFSSYGKRNGYNKYYPLPAPAVKMSDCMNPVMYSSNGTWPLAESLGASPRYMNPDSFQLISAGSNGEFGPGTQITGYAGGVWAGNNLWSLRTPGPAYTGATAGSDDQSNFHSLLLGVPAE